MMARKLQKGWNPDCGYKVLCVETGEVFEDSRYAAEWVINQGLSRDKKGHVSERIRRACRKEPHFDKITIYEHFWEFIVPKEGETE